MLKKLNVIFMGTPAFALPALEALISSEHEVVSVYSQPPRPRGRGHKLQLSPTHELAQMHGIPVFTPATLKAAEAQAEFAALDADIAVVVAYGLILPQAILNAPTHGCVNIHPSALPRWRGAAPIQRTIMAGDTTTEICIMNMDAGLDTGDVYLRSETVAIAPEMNAGNLHDVLAKRSAPLLIQTLEAIASGAATATPQAEDGVTYADKIRKEESRIDWSWPAEKIKHHIRGLAPSPGATTMLGGEVLKVYSARYTNRVHHADAGTALDSSLSIACADGTVQLLEVQKAGKPRMSSEAFLRGHPVAKGAKFE